MKLASILTITVPFLLGTGCTTVPFNETVWEYKIMKSHRSDSHAEEELNQLASEGWVVDSAQIREPSNYVFILKRRR